MHAATLSSKFQLSIPKQLREELQIKAGQKFLFIPKGNVIMLVPQLSLKDIEGKLAGANTQNIRDRKDRY